METARPRCVIVGGGFGGLTAALHISKLPYDVTLIDRRNFHLFQPLLYQVATGGLSPANIAAPLRSILRRRKNVRVVQAEVQTFDLSERRVTTSAGDFAYEVLIVAAGVRHAYFGRDDWADHAPGLKSIEDATALRSRILSAFEQAEITTDPDARRRLLTFVVIGGGPTGVEMAGAIGELAHRTLRQEFRQSNPGEATILLLEAGERILPAYPAALSAKAVKSLQKLGVAVMTGAKVTGITAHQVTYDQQGTAHSVATRNIVWCAGVQAAPLGRLLAEAAGADLDRAGRVMVNPDLTLPGHPEVFVIGDLAHCKSASGAPLPGVAPVAMQQGRFVARCLADRLAGRPAATFRYHDKGSMATIGPGAAVALVAGWQLSGVVAWLAWLLIHLWYLVGFENRFLVFFQWAWCFFTRNRSARLITEVAQSVPPRLEVATHGHPGATPPLIPTAKP